jgi:hypothetical protein
MVGESFFGFGLWKIAGEAPQQPRTSSPTQQVELMRYLHPTQGKLAFRELAKVVGPPGQGS